MSSNLENEDLENIPLVRMEDVQPARDRNCEIYCVEVGDNDLETCIVDDLEYDNECIVDNDEDSNVGSMVSIHSEEVLEDSDSAETIVPEVLETRKRIEPVIVTAQNFKEIKAEKNPDSWPTLEILPGGVIKHSEKNDEDLTTIYPNEELNTELQGENMYACAKCPESFKFLYCLVKHVRWHETQEKKQDLSKICTKESKYVCLHSVGSKSKLISKTHKKRISVTTPKKTKS